MAYTQAHLDALQAALAKGEKRVSLGDKTVEPGVRPPAAGGSTATSEYSNTVEVNDAPTCGWNGAAWPFAYASEQRKRPPGTVAFLYLEVTR